MDAMWRVAVKFTRKAHISKHIKEHTQVKNLMSVPGMVVLGNFPDRTSSRGISEYTPETNPLAVTYVNDRSVDPTICHCTSSGMDDLQDLNRFKYRSFF